VEARPFALLPTDGFLRAQLFETHNEIARQISTISPETVSRGSHQVKARSRAPIPLIYRHQTAPMIVAIQGLEPQAREFRRAIDEINHA